MIALAFAVVLGGMAAYVYWTLRDMPDPGQVNVMAGTVTVYDRHGQVIEQRNSEGQYHVPLKLSQMGKYGPAATLAAEDRNFYHHGAIDWPATLRALFVDLRSGGYTQGGSTITQQLIKIQLLTPQKSIFRKFQEALLAEAVERRYTKDQVLEMYLNRVYYGHGAYGIGAATKTYFGKDKNVSDLDPAQAALLAGLIRAPSFYDPQLHYQYAKDRQLYVLDGLVKTGVLTQAEADKAAKENIQPELKYDVSYRASKAPHFVQYVMSNLENQFGPSELQQGGISVYTTLDLSLQAKADAAVKHAVSSLSPEGVNNGDMLAANPQDGEVLVWVGSADFFNNQIGGQNDYVTAHRQPGSSFKPYVYETGLKNRQMTLATILDDKPTDFNGYKPFDWDNSYQGKMSARKALVESRNIPAVQTGQKVGIDNAISLAQDMMNDHPNGGNDPWLKNNLPTAIGGSEVTMFNHLQGYQTFANQGKRVPLMTVTKVTDASGNVLFQQTPGQQDGISQILTPAETYLITDVLKHYQDVWGLGWNMQMAGKSGTAGGAAFGVHSDAWMMAYNPKIVVGAWAAHTSENGNGKPVATFGTEVGQTALADFLNSLPSSYQSWYSRPDGIVDGKGCPGIDDSSHEIFLAGTEDLSGCPKPSPSPSPTPSPTPKPTPTPVRSTPTPPIVVITPTPSAPPVGTPSPSPSPT